MNPNAHTERCCETCLYRMRSETSSTGYRCGYDYYQTPRLLRKFKTMGQYPSVRPFTACESWASRAQDLPGQPDPTLRPSPLLSPDE